MLQQDELFQDISGRERTEARLRFLYGESTLILKSKACASSSASTLMGRVLDPVQFGTFLSEMVYPDWGGEPNTLEDVAQLVAIESNKSSCYLIFQPLT